MGMGFQAARCPECSGDLQVPDNRDFVKCMFCGRDIQVRQAILDGAAGRVANWMQLARAAADADNHGEAYRYFTKVLEVDPSNYEAWFGKAEAAGWDSNLKSGRFTELLSGVQRAVQLAPADIQQPVKERGASVIGAISIAYFRLSHEHFIEFVALDGSWIEHIQRCSTALLALDGANRLDPRNRTVLESGVQISKSLLDGTDYDDPYDTDDGIAKSKTYHLADGPRAEVQKFFDTFVAKMKALDPTYKAPEIQIAGSTGCGAMIAGLVVLVMLGLGVWWVVKMLFFRN